MLQLYKPIDHDIFKLQKILEYLVLSVWCEADKQRCRSKMNEDLIALSDDYQWLKTKINHVYKQCKSLNQDERTLIRNAFLTNNNIEMVCNGSTKLITLDEMPKVVNDDMKPLLVDFYETLLERAKVPGTKKDYYKKLIKANDFKYCPACGLTLFESEDSKYREAFDHYLPKSDYPFTSVNFKNLVPLCKKCNSDRKKVENPVEGMRKAFYPFSNTQHDIPIKLEMNKSKALDKLKREDLTICFSGDTEKLDTWDILFGVKERYNDHIREELKTRSRVLKTKHRQNLKRNSTSTFIETIDDEIETCNMEKYSRTNFLYIAILEYFKSRPDIININ